MKTIPNRVPIVWHSHRFTYADLGFIALHERYRLVGEEELRGRHAYKVEEQAPQEQSYYSRIITWIATDSMLPLQRDYFDHAGRLIQKIIYFLHLPLQKSKNVFVGNWKIPSVDLVINRLW